MHFCAYSTGRYRECFHPVFYFHRGLPHSEKIVQILEVTIDITIKCAKMCL